VLQPATSQARLHVVPGHTSRYVCSVGRRADICSLKELDGEVHLNLSKDGTRTQRQINFQSGMNLNQESCMTYTNLGFANKYVYLCLLYVVQYIETFPLQNYSAL
jgi:hypothetical protein